jgi:transcriptional regulator with GAF, ATPase, and Fis domain
MLIFYSTNSLREAPIQSRDLKKIQLKLVVREFCNSIFLHLYENNMVPPIIGKSRAIGNIKTLISKVAPTGENILICGKTGVGKDLVEQSLYHQSKRVGKPFVKVNCAGLTDSIDIEPLRDRPEDIPLLIDYYFKKYASAYNGHYIMALPNRWIMKTL